MCILPRIVHRSLPEMQKIPDNCRKSFFFFADTTFVVHLPEFFEKIREICKLLMEKGSVGSGTGTNAPLRRVVNFQVTIGFFHFPSVCFHGYLGALAKHPRFSLLNFVYTCELLQFYPAGILLSPDGPRMTVSYSARMARASNETLIDYYPRMTRLLFSRPLPCAQKKMV